MSADHCSYFCHLLAAAAALAGSGLLAGDTPLPAPARRTVLHASNITKMETGLTNYPLGAKVKKC